ncbi:phosphate/phosphite/phosphonate ABC transporter substrate-binding protein [Anaeromyxobacter oryzisoli]|uniref:phosphate/phosphite/phosphonate ABC transporter substrate-binding protein n=1 Tax=Anaeromyxobacter oryzisoli TaxID=2925408 RepID=UPI001F592A66|nr:phosphate/phosphite/phosphonate ABC transporter substrate-binding protein [Anaeromyxobacter sp. SG63]
MAVKRILAALVLLLLGAAAPAGAQEIKLGVLPRLSATELNVMFRPLADHLGRATGRKVTLVIARDFDTFQKQVRDGELDLAFANPLVYAQLKKERDLVPLGLGAEKKGGTKFRGVIIVRKDSGFSSVAALRGKRLIFVDADSLGGYISQALLLKKQGLDLKRDFVLLPFAKKHDNVTMAVFNRAADAGGIREDDLEKMKGKIDLGQIKVLAYTDSYPNWPLFSTPRLRAADRETVRAALLALRPGDPVLQAAKLTVFAPVSDKDYDALREAARTVGAL